MTTKEAPIAREEEQWKDDDFLSFDVPPRDDPNDETSKEYDSMAEGDDMETSSSSSDDDETNGKKPPWMLGRLFPNHNETKVHALTHLHNEIVSFTTLMEPLPSELEQRNQLVERLRATVLKHFGDDAQLQVFGSQATGLLLPTSDIDLVLTTPQSTDDATTDTTHADKNNKTDKNGYDPSLMLSPMDRFANALEQDWIDELNYLEKVEKTRIPLVKFTHAPTNISVDVSFNQDSGVPAATLIHRFLDSLPPLRPLTFVLKYFLAARDLNQPYTGGMGSYLLQLLIVSFLQQRERDAVNFGRPSAYNLGALLLEFLQFYGLDFNYYTTGISVRHDGFFFPKGAADRRQVYWKPSNSAMMAMENPLEITHDVGSSSYRYQMVQRAFALAYRNLLVRVTTPHLETGPSILNSILPTTPYMTSRLVLKKRDGALSAPRNPPTTSTLDLPLGSKRSQESFKDPRKRQKQS